MADAKQGKTTSEDLYNGSSQSRIILAKPRLGGFASSNFASSSNKSCNPFGSVLRPPQLKTGSNPFYKHSDTPADGDTPKEEQPKDETAERLQNKKEEMEQPKFVPLGLGGASSRSSNPVPTPAQPTTTASSSGFVFGQNLSERVVMAESVSNGEASSADQATSNGTTELLFTNAAATVKDNQEETEPSEKSGEGLAAAAAEYERSHTRPPPLTTNCTMTGEEDEINVLQITCRLFAWESGSWRERGRGVLRLNDAADGSGGSNGGGGGNGSRLVVRVAGSLRVVLNTKLWPDMVVERAGAKSLRITALDAQLQIKLYLIMGAPGDIVHLYRALMTRVVGSKKTISCKQNTTSQRAAERLEASTDDSDYPDKLDNNYDDDSCFEEDKQSFSEAHVDKCREPVLSENRLEIDTKKETDDDKSQDNDMDEENETKLLKRKEPADNEKSPKRLCPEIVIQRP